MIQNRRTFFLMLSFLFFFEIVCISRSYSRTLNEEEQLIHVGVGALKDGLYDIAEKQFSLFLKNFPNHGKVYDVSYLLGKTYFRQKKWKEAKPFFLKISQENKNFDAMDYTLFWMAQIDMKLGNFEMSRGWLLTLLKNYPKFEWMDYAYYLLGCLAFDTQKPGSR